MLQISSLYSFIIQNCFMIFEQKPFTTLSSAKSAIFLTIWRIILFLKQIIQQYLGIYYAIILTVLKSVCNVVTITNCSARAKENSPEMIRTVVRTLNTMNAFFLLSFVVSISGNPPLKIYYQLRRADYLYSS